MGQEKSQQSLENQESQPAKGKTRLVQEKEKEEEEDVEEEEEE